MTEAIMDQVKVVDHLSLISIQMDEQIYNEHNSFYEVDDYICRNKLFDMGVETIICFPHDSEEWGESRSLMVLVKAKDVDNITEALRNLVQTWIIEFEKMRIREEKEYVVGLLAADQNRYTAT